MSVSQMFVSQMSVGLLSFSQKFVSQMSVGQLSFSKILSAKCLLIKCLSAKCLSAKCLLVYCLSACCLSAKCLLVKCLLAKCLSAKCLLVKCLLTKCLSAKCLLANVCWPHFCWENVCRTNVCRPNVFSTKMGGTLNKRLDKRDKIESDFKTHPTIRNYVFFWSRIQNFQFILNLVKLPSKLQCYITLGWKSLPGTNTQAYCAHLLFMNGPNKLVLHYT
jgi:hypothetical protein